MLHTLRFSLQNAIYFIMLPFLLFGLFGFYLCCSVYCLRVNVYCHRVTTQLQLINILYYIIIGSCIIHILHTGVLNFKCKTPVPKG
jgi:hypothetical protein